MYSVRKPTQLKWRTYKLNCLNQVIQLESVEGDVIILYFYAERDYKENVGLQNPLSCGPFQTGGCQFKK